MFSSRYIKVKVEQYLMFMFSPPKISWVVSEIKYIILHLLPVFYLIQPSSKRIICFDFRKQNSVLPSILCTLVLLFVSANFIFMNILKQYLQICCDRTVTYSPIFFEKLFLRIDKNINKNVFETPSVSI